MWVLRPAIEISSKRLKKGRLQMKWSWLGEKGKGEGGFELASPETILKETRLLLEKVEVTSQFLSDHISNLLPLDGKLPEDKGRMIQMIDEALRELENGGLREDMEM